MARIILLLMLLAVCFFLGTSDYPFLTGAAVITSCLFVLWLISLILQDSSIIDIFWGTGFVIAVWFYRYKTGFSDLRSLIFCIMVSLWGLRLSLYLAIRNIGKGEDYRYREWRQQYGQNWWWVSLFRVFLLQGVILWVVSSLFVPAMSRTSFGFSEYVGIYFWVVGILFEAGGDWQLMQFKKDPENKGKVLNTGLWAMTRHPNYFGDALIWWGYFLFVLPSGQYFYVFSPLLMSFLLMEVSGVTLLEKKLSESKPGYADYIKNVPAFFPKLPGRRW